MPVRPIPPLLPLLPLLLLLLASCAPDPESGNENSSTVSVSERMSTTPDPGFLQALQPREFDFPADHGAHPGYATEWWYFTGNLTTAAGARFGYQFTLFRVGLEPGPPAADSPWRSNQLYMGHLAVTDIGGQHHRSAEHFSRAAAGLAGAQIAPVRIWLGSWQLKSDEVGDLFPLRLQADTEDIGLQLTLEHGSKPRVLQGERGLSRKSAAPGNASYYYSHTRLPTRGRLMLDGQWHEVAGNSWFDREWSSSALAQDQAGWDWFSLQLDDGRDLMFYRMRDQQGQAQQFSQGVLVRADGTVKKLDLDNTDLRASGFWDTADGVRYPVEWHLSIPAEAIELQVKAAVPDQEMRHSVRYWEGAVQVSGSHTGVGYLELSGYASTREPLRKSGP